MSKFAPEYIPGLSDRQETALTRQASTAPQVRGTGSAIGDAFEGLGMLMQIKQRGDAAQALQAEAQREQAFMMQEQDFQDQATKGGLELSKVMTSLQTGKANKVTANMKINEILNRYKDPAMQAAVLKVSEDLTGKTAFGFISDQEEEAQTEATRRLDLETRAAQGMEFWDGAAVDTNSMTQEQLEAFIVETDYNKAVYNRKASQIERNAKEDEKSRKRYTLDFLTAQGNELSTDVQTIIKDLDFKDTDQLSYATSEIDRLLRDLPILYMRDAEKEHSLTVSTEQAQEAVKPLTTWLKSMREVATGEQFQSMEKVRQSAMLKEMFSIAQRGGDSETVLPFIAHTYAKVPISPHIAAAAGVPLAKAFKKMSAKEAPEAGGAPAPDTSTDTASAQDELREDLLEEGLNEEEAEEVVQAFGEGVTKPVVGEQYYRTEGQQRTLLNSILNDLNPGTDEKLVRNMKNVQRRIEFLAGENLPEVLPENADKIARDLSRPMQLMLSKFGSQFHTRTGSLRSNSLNQFGVQPITAQKPVREVYEYSPEKRRIVQKDSSQSISTTYPVSKVNRTIENLFKLHENLGLGTEVLESYLNQAFMPIQPEQ